MAVPCPTWQPAWQQQWVPRTLDQEAPFLFPAGQEGRAKLHPRPKRGDSWREECEGLARQAGCGREAGVEPEPALYGHGGCPLILGDGLLSGMEDGHLSPRIRNTNLVPLHITKNIHLPALGQERKGTLFSPPFTEVTPTTHLGLPTAVRFRHLVGEIRLFKASGTHSLVCGGV